MCQGIFDLEFWDLTLPPGLGHPGMSPDIPRHLGPGTLGPNTASRSGTYQDVPGYPRTSWTWDSQIEHCLLVWDIPGCPCISWDILDLGLWDLTLPLGLEHPGMSPDIPELGLWDLTLPLGLEHPGMSPDIPGPGTLGLNTASTSGISRDVSGDPRTSWTWDSGI